MVTVEALVLLNLNINNTLANSEDLTLTLGLPRSDLCRYLQIRHFLRCNDSNFPLIPSMSAMDTLLDSSMDPPTKNEF